MDDGNVIWIDCEDTFKPRRIVEMLMAREEIESDEAKEKLSHITYLYCPNTEQLLGTVNALSKTLLDKKPVLVVLDGAIGQFREEYLGRGTLADRQMQIARLMTHIKNISFYFRCPVVFTNQVLYAMLEKGEAWLLAIKKKTILLDETDDFFIVKSAKEKILDEISFTATDRSGEKIIINKEYINKNLDNLVKDTDLSNFIL